MNKNSVPNDPRSPFVTSGLRVGTPAITTRGFGEAESVELTHWICDVLDSLEKGTSATVIAQVKEKVLAHYLHFEGNNQHRRCSTKVSLNKKICAK